MKEVPQGPVQDWLSDCTSRLMEVLGASNFYTAIATAHHDNVVFGTAPVICYEDFEDVVHFFTPCAGEYMVGLNAKLEPDTLYREYTLTIDEAVKTFGLEALSVSTRARRQSPPPTSTPKLSSATPSSRTPKST